MDVFKNWAIGVCLASLAGTLIYFVSPSGGTQKLLKTVLSVFLIAVMINPIAAVAKSDFNEISSGYTYIDEKNFSEDDVNRIIFEQYVKNTENAVKLKFEERRTEIINLFVHASINERNRIIIERIDITVKAEDENKVSEAVNAIKEQFNTTVNVNFAEEL